MFKTFDVCRLLGSAGIDLRTLPVTLPDMVYARDRHGPYDCNCLADEDHDCWATWCIVETAVTTVFRLRLDEIGQDTRGMARAAFARQVAMYLAHVACHHSYTQVGRMANRDRTTVAYACAVVEDARDDPVIDTTLDHLERCVTLMRHRRFAHEAGHRRGAP